MKRSSILLLSSVVMLFVLLSASKCNNKPAKTAKEEAIELYNKGLEMDINGNYRQAFIFYSQSIEKDSTSGDAFTNRGVVRILLEDTLGAISDYEKASFIDKTKPTPLNNLGIIYASRQKYDKAQEFFEKAITVDSSYADTYYNYGVVLYEMKSFEKAIQMFERFAISEESIAQRLREQNLYDDLMPVYYANLARGFFYLGLCHKNIGNTDKAAYYLKQAADNGVEDATDSLKTITRK
ncbi:tetratricopeptide repeat protein [Porphyromonas macacae]|nr:tetratricopeptide repeat protein [Porphyromonas macacae]